LFSVLFFAKARPPKIFIDNKFVFLFFYKKTSGSVFEYLKNKEQRKSNEKQKMTTYLSQSQGLTLDVEKNNASRAVKKWMFESQVNMENAVILHQGIKGATCWLNLLARRLAEKSFGYGDDDIVLDMLKIIESIAGQFYIMQGAKPEQTLAMIVNYFCNPGSSKRMARGIVDLRLCWLFYDILLRPVHAEKTGRPPPAASGTYVPENFAEGGADAEASGAGGAAPPPETPVEELNAAPHKLFSETGIEPIGIATVVANATPGEMKRAEVATVYIIDVDSDLAHTFMHVVSYVYSVIAKIVNVFPETPAMAGTGDATLEKCAANVTVVFNKVREEVKKSMTGGQTPGIAGCLCERDKKTRKVKCECDKCENGYTMLQGGVEVEYNEYVNIASFPSFAKLCGRGIKPAA
jgi:hypothetical protein